MFKYLFGLILILTFNGCSVTWAEFQDGYKSAKIIYKDVKYVVYEVVEEKKQVEAEYTALRQD